LLLLLDYTKTFVKDLVVPPAGLLLLAIVGALLVRRRPRVGRTLLALALASLWLLSLPIVAGRLAHWSDRYAALDLRRPVSAQAIVILGGGGQRKYAPEYGGPAADPYLLERLAYGAYLAREVQLPVLVTGFRVEAVAMRATLERNFGIVPRWVDRDAYDTFDNARNSARLLHDASINRIVLVTSATHMWRAVHEFDAAGLSVVPAPVHLMPPQRPTVLGFIPNAEALLRSSTVVYETLGNWVRMVLAATHLRRQQPLPPFHAPESDRLSRAHL
jgi:uncharacterized SAM-binding protein YcdF (DUF218 family)